MNLEYVELRRGVPAPSWRPRYVRWSPFTRSVSWLGWELWIHLFNVGY